SRDRTRRRTSETADHGPRELAQVWRGGDALQLRRVLVRRVARDAVARRCAVDPSDRRDVPGRELARGEGAYKASCGGRRDSSTKWFKVFGCIWSVRCCM